MKTKIVTFISLLLLSQSAWASHHQNDESIMQPIHALFDGMREGDGDKVRSAFAEQAIFYRAHQTLRAGSSVEEFAAAVEAEREHIWDEKIWDIKVHVDDKLASVWTQFAFYLGDTFSHCGANSFQLYRFDEGWKIIYLVDTRRTEDCEVPPKR